MPAIANLSAKQTFVHHPTQSKPTTLLSNTLFTNPPPHRAHHYLSPTKIPSHLSMESSIKRPTQKKGGEGPKFHADTLKTLLMKGLRQPWASQTKNQFLPLRIWTVSTLTVAIPYYSTKQDRILTTTFIKPPNILSLGDTQVLFTNTPLEISQQGSKTLKLYRTMHSDNSQAPSSIRRQVLKHPCKDKRKRDQKRRFEPDLCGFWACAGGWGVSCSSGSSNTGALKDPRGFTERKASLGARFSSGMGWKAREEPSKLARRSSLGGPSSSPCFFMLLTKPLEVDTGSGGKLRKYGGDLWGWRVYVIR